MTKKTHILGGIALAMVGQKLALGSSYENLSTMYQYIGTSSYYLTAVFASLLPDIDKPESTIGKRVPILPSLINKVFGHRMITHSLMIIAVIAALFTYFKPDIATLYPFIMYGFLIGYFSHILLDMFTVSGVPLFYPSKKRFRIMKIRTGKGGEKIFRYVLIGLMIIYASINIRF